MPFVEGCWGFRILPMVADGQASATRSELHVPSYPPSGYPPRIVLGGVACR